MYIAEAACTAEAVILTRGCRAAAKVAVSWPFRGLEQALVTFDALYMVSLYRCTRLSIRNLQYHAPNLRMRLASSGCTTVSRTAAGNHHINRNLLLTRLGGLPLIWRGQSSPTSTSMSRGYRVNVETALRSCMLRDHMRKPFLQRPRTLQ